MPRYRILFRDENTSNFVDVESNSLAHALWEVAKMHGYGMDLVDTMALPDKSNSYGNPVHVNLYPEWTKDE